jgi:hypothetical protein
MNRTYRIFVAAAAVSSAVGASAQSLNAFQGLYAQAADGSFTLADGHGDANGPLDPFTVSRDFTGLDSQGNTQTMNVSGTAYSSADYGRVHLYGQGTITNPYYNPANPSVVNSDGSFNPDGSPELLAIHGNAGWNDSYTYTGFEGTGYKVNYYFRLDGDVSGDTETQLHFNFSGAGTSGFYDSPLIHTDGAATTHIDQVYVTPDYDVVWGEEESVNLDVFSGLSSHLSQRPEGVTIDGEAAFQNTLQLLGVVVKDANGNVVTGYTVQTASGVNYVNPVPEPTTLFILGIGSFAAICRKRQR